MGVKHLTTGSEQPPKTDKLRLYSMEYCPYVHRVRLVLAAKGIPFELVNINLINKPEWYFQVHPEGKVPALDTGKEVIVESLDIANYLEETYTDPPLYPAEPAAKEQDKALIDKIGPIIGVFARLMFTQEQKTPEEWVKEFLPLLEVFENELQKRGTPFFFGDRPGMVDYMLWPWAERAGVVGIHLGQKLPLEDDQLPFLRKWRKLMRDYPVVAGIYHGPEKFYKCVQMKIAGAPPDYDSI